jgi:acyl-homoserine lactone acylase PvdQ
VKLARLLPLVVALALLPAMPAAAQVQPYGFDNQGDFNDVLPPGTNGLVTLSQALSYESTGVPPPHNNDQLAMYSNLTTAAPNITEAQIGNYYKDATFGVPAGDVGSTETPEPGVTIEWDARFGVPHIYGDTRAELMFGIGWATAEDRLFFIDALRHAGRGQLASFAGGSNASMDEGVWANEPYTQQDLVNQVNWARQHLPGGAQVFDDAQNYVDGINAYIAKAENPMFTATMMPAEYTLLGTLPQPFTVEDVVSIATLVGGLFGGGGGAQLQNAVVYEQLVRRFGAESFNVPGAPAPVAHPVAGHPSRAHPDHSGLATFLSFDDPNDPEAPTTVSGTSFPYQTLPAPSAAVARTVALPDPGSVHYADTIAAGSLPSAADIARAGRSGSSTALGVALGPLANAGPGLLRFPPQMSNALLVSARDSASGHPLAVMGPQVSYFSPEILMEEDIHGPGIDATGAAFAGANLYVELGHGTDYAWSATSSGQNIIDTFAVKLCKPGGGRPLLDSNHYLLHGRCVAMQTLTDQESWKPNLADPTPAGSVTFRTQRTAFGIVIARAKVRGRPVAYCNLRSTYMHELDSAIGFSAFNDPSEMATPHDFFKAAAKVGYTFNWFYANGSHIAYYNSGANPVRAPNTDPLFPAWSKYAWSGYKGQAQLTPAGLTERETPPDSHPHTIDQPFLTSWNNKQAPGYGDPATAQEFSSVYRSQLLDLGIEHYLRTGDHKLTLAQLIDAMGNAGTQDLRGVEVLPYALAVIGHPRGPSTLAAALATLRTWVATGAHRINREHPGASGLYDQGAAVQLMDAWWPLLVKAEFGPVLGARGLAAVESEFSINDEPGSNGAHLGSAFDVGFYGIVQKDLRAVLGRHVGGRLNRVFCGDGSLRACRVAVERSLLQAAAESPAVVYPADGVCHAGDQMCHDAIEFRAIGAIKQPLIEWVNRPTFQQADELTGP